MEYYYLSMTGDRDQYDVFKIKESLSKFILASRIKP